MFRYPIHPRANAVLPKLQVAGYSYTHIHPTYAASRAETAAVPRGTSHVTTKQRCKYTPAVDIQERAMES